MNRFLIRNLFLEGEKRKRKNWGEKGRKRDRREIGISGKRTERERERERGD